MPMRSCVFICCLVAGITACSSAFAGPADPSQPTSKGNWAGAVTVGGAIDGVSTALPTFTFGIHPAATASYDRGLDQVPAPPHPNPLFPVAYFVNDAHPALTQQVSVDLRAAPTDVVEGASWVLVVDNRSLDAWTVAWDVSDLPGDWDEISIDDGSGPIDMRGASGLSIPGGSAETYTIRLRVNPNDAPTFLPILDQVTLEDEPLEITVSGVGPGAADEAGQAVFLEAISSDPSIVPHPVVEGTGDTRTFTITPTPDGVGEVEITLVATDDGPTGDPHANASSATFLVTVLPVNDAPTLDALADMQIPEDAPEQTVALSGLGVGGGSDESSQTLTVTATSNRRGFIPNPVVRGSGLARELVFTAAANRHGDVTITVTVTDDGPGNAPDVNSLTRTFVVSVAAVNDVPVVQGIASSTTYQSVPVDILIVASDVDGDTLEFVVTTDPGNGVLEPASGVLTAGELTVTYTPEPDFSGTDTFTFVVNDGTDATASIAASVEVLPNDPPTVSLGAGAKLSIVQGLSVVIPLEVFDPDSDSFTINVVRAPTNGTVRTESGLLGVVYSADPTFVGTDPFTVSVTDGEGATSPALDIVVEATLPNRPPVIAAPAPVVTPKNTLAIIIIDASDPDGDVFNLVPQSFPQNGTIEINGLVGGYTPVSGFVGGDTFSVRAIEVPAEGEDPASALQSDEVTFQIDVRNTPPVADGTSAETVENTAVFIPLFGSDLDGDAVTFALATAPSSGEAVIEGPTATYTPNPGFSGGDEFQITAFDGLARSEPVTVLVNVLPVNDPPTLRLDPSAVLSVEPGDSLSIGFLVEDPDSAAFSVEIVQGPTKGSVAPFADGVGVTYIASDDGRGEDSFVARVFDDAAAPLPSNDLTVTVNVLVLDQTPTVSDVGPLTGPKNADISVALAGEDPNGDSVTFEVHRAPAHGEVTIDGNRALYTPEEGFSGEDSFAYVATDGEFTSAPGSVFLIVENAVPAVESVTASGVEDEAVVVELIGADADGDALTFEVAKAARRGAVSIEGSIATYIPRADFSGADEFTVVANDGDALSEPAIIAITVAAVDDPPALNTARELDDIRATEGDRSRILNLEGGKPLYVDVDSPVSLSAVTSDLEVVETFLDGARLTLSFVGPGVATVTISAVGSEERSSFEVEVVALELRNDPPDLQPLRSQTVVEGEDLVVTPSASDPDEDALTWNLVSVARVGSAPEGDPDPVVTIDETTGITTFTVASIASAQARFSVAISVSDGVNAPVTRSTLILVTSSNKAPTVSAPSVVVAELDVPVHVEVVVTDSDEGDTVTIEASVREREGRIIAATRSAVRDFNTADVALDAGSAVKTFTFTPSDAVAGRLITLQWVANDGQASSTGTTQIQIGADVNLPPVVEAIEDHDVEEGGRLEVAVVAEDPDAAEGEDMVVEVTGLAGSATFDPASRTILWEEIGFDRQGSYTFTVTATAAGGLTTQETFRVRVLDVNRTPELTGSSSATPDALPGTISLQRLTVLTLAFAGSDPDGDNVTLTVRGVPGWARVKQSGSPTAPKVGIEFEPPRDSEDFTVSVTVTDSGGLTASTEISVVLEDPPNANPSVAEVAPLTVVEEGTATFTVDASDEDGDTLTVTVDPLPTGATFDGGVFVWAPERGQSRNEPYVLAVSVDDGAGGTAETSAQITVLEAPNNDPHISVIQDVTVVEGETATVTAVVTDPDGDETTLDVQTDLSAPNVSVDSTTGEVSFATESGDEGFYSVTVVAIDGRDGEASRTFLLTVESAQAPGVQELAIRAALVSPKTGTAVDVFSFGAVVTTAGEEADSVTLRVVAEDGSSQEADMDPVGAAAQTGARYGVDLFLAPGSYTFTVTAAAGAELATKQVEGPIVEEARIDIFGVAASGSTGDISVAFDLSNPNPGQTVALGAEFREVSSEAWLPATVSGSIVALRSGMHHLTWHSGTDVPGALGETYQLRLTAGDSGKRISAGFRVVNAPPAPPTLDALEPSTESGLVVAGSSDIAGADIEILIDEETVGTTQADEGGAFRFVTGNLQTGSYEIRATASVLGVTSVRSTPVRAIVDAAPPILEIVSPARGSEVPTLEPLISFGVDFGLSGGDPSEVSVALNGKPATVTFDESSELYSVRQKLFDQRVYLASVRASKFNGLTLTNAWAFTVNLAAGDELSPTAVSFKPTGSINDSSPAIKLVVSDSETGIDTNSVEILLNGVPVSTTYSPKDGSGGTAIGNPAEPLSDGSYTASATFLDLAGNTGEAEWSFVVDTTPPAPPTLTSPIVGGPTVTNAPTFTIEGAADPASVVVVAVGGAVAGTATAGADGAWAFSVDLGTGTTTVRTQARDALGNVSELSAPVSIVLDTGSPEIVVATPALDTSTPNLQPTFSGSVTDALSGVDPASVTLEIDSVAVAVTYDEVSGTFTYAAETAFATDTTVQVRVTAADGAGNSAEANGSVTFDARLGDTAAPAILNPRINGIGLVAGAATLIQTDDATIEFTVTDDLSGVAQVFGSLDGVSVDFALSDSTATLVVAGLAEGLHVLLVNAVDAAENVGDPEQYDIVLDVGTTVPTLDVPALTNAADLVIRGGGIEEGAGVTVLVNGVPVETTVEGGSFQTSTVSLLEGANTIAATATDRAGNSAEADPVTVTLDATAPELSLLAPLSDSTVNAQADTLTIRATDAGGIDVTRVDLVVDGEPVTPSVSADGTITYVAPQAFAGSGSPDPAAHFVSIVVGDLAGNTSRLGAQFFVDGTPPTVEGFIPNANEIVPSLEPTISGTIVATDLDLSSVDVLVGRQDTTLGSVVGDPNYDIDPGTGQFSYFPLLEDKTTYQVVVRAADQVGNVVVSTWAFAVDTDAEDTNEPTTTILFPQPGDNINEVSLDILSFAVGDAAGVGSVTMFVNDPTGSSPLSIGQLEEEGIAQFNRNTGVIRIFGRRLLAPKQGARGGFSFDPLELNALERSLTGGDNASFDPLGLGSLDASLSADTGADVAALERSLTSGAGLFGAGGNNMSVQVSDLSGNVSFASWSFEVTLDPPAAPTFATTTALRNSRSASIGGHVPDLAVSGGLPLTVSLRVNGSPSGVLEITSVDGAFTFDNVNLSDGDNLITATAQDSAGNLSDRSDTLTVVLDEVAPTIAVDPVATEASSSFFTITGSISDNQKVDLGSVTLRVNEDEIALSKSQGRFSQSVTLSDGSNTLRVVVRDVAGNETESEEYTVRLDLAPPTTAPENITALPTADSRGIRLGWTADANAGSYNVYRSLVAFGDASALTPVAASVRGTAYTDTTVLPGRMVYYAVVSVDGAGNSDASVISPVLPVALMKDAGGVAALDDGTSLRVPRNSLFANALLTGTVEISTPSSTPDLDGGIDGTAREVVVRASSGSIVQTFNLAAALTHPVPAGVPVEADSPQTYQLSGQDWEGLTSATDPQLRTVTADIAGSGTYQLGEVDDDAAPWDVNGDNTVNIVDLVTVARVFGQTVSAGDPADTNGDGVVNIVDLVTVSTHFGETTGVVGAPSRTPQGEPVVNVYTRVVGSRGGVGEVEVVAESSVNLAGYELAIDPGAGEIKSMTRGDVFGREAFWMDPAPVDGATRVASVRLDLASSGIAVRKSGVLARLTVNGATGGVEAELQLRDIRFSDRRGKLLPYRIGPPPPVARDFATALLPNYPNPFNPETWIPFTLSKASTVTLRVYNVDGQVIRTLDLGAREAGSYASREGAAYWDGRNSIGEEVASGVYFYELSADAYREIRRMVILK